MPIELTLPLLNHFLRLSMGGWDSLPVNDKLQRETLFPIIQELDPEERFWHIEGDIIWKTDPWKETWEKALARREKRELEAAYNERKRIKFTELVSAIQQKLGKGMELQQAEEMARQIIRNRGSDVALHFGVDIAELLEGEVEQVYQVIDERGKVSHEY